MQTIILDQANPSKDEINLICETLLAGKTIAYPTDTIMGLGCLADNEKAVRKVYRKKERPPGRPLLILIKSYCMLHSLAYVSGKQDRYIRSIWPKTTRDAHNFSKQYRKKPTTFILGSRGKLPGIVSGGQNSLAVRMPRNEFLIKILKKVDAPLISTSLNKHRQKPPKGYKNLENYFKIKPDLIILPPVLPEYKPSSIIDIRDINNIKVLRK
jgi:L-threonylcarbamoyladenylate synthase